MLCSSCRRPLETEWGRHDINGQNPAHVRGDDDQTGLEAFADGRGDES